MILKYFKIAKNFNFEVLQNQTHLEVSLNTLVAVLSCNKLFALACMFSGEFVNMVLVNLLLDIWPGLQQCPAHLGYVLRH